MTMLHRVEFVCTNCTTTFEDEAVVSATLMNGQTSDFRPIDTQLLAVVIHTCPACGYTGYEAQFFDGPAPVPADVARQIAEHLTPAAATIRLSAARRYEAAARIAEWNDAPHNAIGDFYLKAAWCCDAGTEVTSDDDEAHYRRKAIGWYERYLAGDADEDQAPGITYLVGELYRRIGEPETAAVWFDRMIAMAADDPDLAGMAEVAARQKTEPRDVM